MILFFLFGYIIIMVIYICLRLRKRRNVENIDNITTQLVSPNPYTGEYTGEIFFLIFIFLFLLLYKLKINYI